MRNIFLVEIDVKRHGNWYTVEVEGEYHKGRISSLYRVEVVGVSEVFNFNNLLTKGECVSLRADEEELVMLKIQETIYNQTEYSYAYQF